jgi:hypothetical protein
MTDSSRTQGALICGGVGLVALLFVIGLLRGSYLALAIPVAGLTLFVLGLAFWVGWTIATIRVEPEPAADAEPEGNTAEPAGDAAPMRPGQS